MHGHAYWRSSGLCGGVEHGALRMPALGGSLFDPDKSSLS